MGKLYKATLRPDIDPEWLRRIQEEGRRKLEEQREARRLAGEDLKETARAQIRALLSGPKLDFDLDQFLRDTANCDLDEYFRNKADGGQDVHR